MLFLRLTHQPYVGLVSLTALIKVKKTIKIMAQSKLCVSVARIGDLFRRAKDSVMVSEDSGVQQSITCPFCTREERLQTFGDLKAGNHICLYGNKATNIAMKHVALYRHHAIVEEVEVLNDFSAKLTFIQFSSTSFDSVNRIQRSCEIKGLPKDEIYVLHYKHPVHTPEKILERARKLLIDGDNVVYSGLERDCEHLCNLCCAGSDESLQVHKGFTILFHEVLSSVGSIGSKILRVLLRLFFMTIDDLTRLLVVEIAVPWGVLSGVVVIQLICCAYQHFQCDKQFNVGTMCYSCCKQTKINLWLRFGAFCVLQVGGLKLLSLVSAAIASKGVLRGIMSTFSIITIGLIWAIPKIRRNLCAPFQGREIKIIRIDQIWPGDVIKIKRRTYTRHGVVSYVKAYGPEKKTGRIKIIHYNKPGMLRNRTVVEFEDFYDLNKVKITQLDYSAYNCHDAETVIRRARKRVGEKKYGLLSNRNCHFCHWAKVSEEVSENFDQSSEPASEIVNRSSIRFGKTIKVPSFIINHRSSKTWARITDEVKAGQVIGLGVLRNKAVCTHVTCSKSTASRLSVSIVRCFRNCKVCEETVEVDLNEEDIWIYPYHPLFRFGSEEVVRRARERIGRGGYNHFTHRSSHLAAEIVERGIDEQVHSLRMLETGDVISFDYWGVQHEAVVSKVQPEESKETLSQEPSIGKITVIHYALPRLFAKRTIIEETFRFNLIDQVVYLKRYDSYITYPREIVVQRARSRKGEQRFSVFSNTSSKFVHWAKVIQTPALVAMAEPRAKQNQSPGDQAPLMPHFGKQYKNFQTVQVHTWSELQPGSIISYRYYCIWHEGILTEADENEKRIKVIHYGTRHIFARREISEDTLSFDPRYDQLCLHRCDPRLCKKADEILRCARRRLGEKNWKSEHRSWDFCLDCVLKKRSRSTSPTRLGCVLKKRSRPTTPPMKLASVLKKRSRSTSPTRLDCILKKRPRSTSPKRLYCVLKKRSKSTSPTALDCVLKKRSRRASPTTL